MFNLPQRAQYLEGELKKKYIGEIKKIQNELSGQTIGPEKVPYQVTVDGKREVRFYESTDQELTNLGKMQLRWAGSKRRNIWKACKKSKKNDSII